MNSFSLKMIYIDRDTGLKIYTPTLAATAATGEITAAFHFFLFLIFTF